MSNEPEASDNQDSLKQRIKKTFSDLPDMDESVEKIKKGLSKLGSIGKGTKQKFEDFTQSIIDALPIIEEAGFRSNRFIIGVSIPPNISIHFQKTKDVKDEDLERLKEQHKERKSVKLILNALATANRFQRKMNIRGMDFSEICLDITIPPKVSLKYLHKKVAESKNDLLDLADG
ncbi:MAG: hypothetical protein MRY83_00365, partial [Flavobacteriales bacterium]|nr:hypothetical protein [Flavobacteriales bacterium]